MFALVLFVCYLDGGCEDIVVDVYNTEQHLPFILEVHSRTGKHVIA
ncbi:DUF1482 family protein, partial [Escherichia sp. HC-CC]